MSKLTKRATIRFTLEDAERVERVMKYRNLNNIFEAVKTLFREDAERQGSRQ